MQDSLTSSTRNECARLVGRLTLQEHEIISQDYIKAFKMTSLEHVFDATFLLLHSYFAKLLLITIIFFSYTDYC